MTLLSSIAHPPRTEAPARSPRREGDTAARIGAALERFTAWLAAYGETSWDHQSYFAGPIGGRAKALYYRRRWLGTLAVAPMILSEAFVPSARRLFWKKQRFPIADAHYAMGYAALWHCTRDEVNRWRALHFIEVLEHTRCPGWQHHAWGYPFDWVTRTGVMAAQTPLITSTPYAYEAYEAMHAIDPEPRWLDAMRSAAEHAYTDIHDRVLHAESASAGYNPFDTEGGVVNASAYRAFMLTSAGLRFSRDDYLQAARRNLRYVLDAQREDGAWPYATDGVRDFVDHFHTCFVLKALAKIERLVPDARCTRAIEAGIDYYVRHLFDGDGLPRPFAQAPRLTVYRQELYDYAECINLGTLLRGRDPALDERRERAVSDLLARWQKPDGSFRSRRLLIGWDPVPMHRWAQAQTFRSLSVLLQSLQSQQSQQPGTARSRRSAPPAHDLPNTTAAR